MRAHTRLAALAWLLMMAASATSATPATSGASPAISDLEHAFERAAEGVGGAVVSVTALKMRRAPGSPPDSPLDELLRDPIRGFFGGEPEQERGLGSGVVVDRSGIILTNNHVIAGADELKVHVKNDRVLKAKVLGADPKSDLAVIKVDAKDLPAVSFADSDKLRIGQWVLAIGSPFGLEQSVTAGIVSAKGRSNVGLVDYEDMIQTDAAINPGNSGGPLVNLEGKVVGINTAMATRSGGYQGVGFAIPSNMARSIMQQLINRGKVVRGWLGVSIQKLTPELGKASGHEGGGVVVAEVTPDGPAARAGLASGDVVVALEGRPVTDVAAFRNRIADSAPGVKLTLDVVRQGKTQRLPVTIGELPPTDTSHAPAQGDLGNGVDR